MKNETYNEIKQGLTAIENKLNQKNLGEKEKKELTTYVKDLKNKVVGKPKPKVKHPIIEVTLDKIIGLDMDFCILGESDGMQVKIDLNWENLIILGKLIKPYLESYEKECEKLKKLEGENSEKNQNDNQKKPKNK